jgi:DNA-binding GntR family transcriptional regulator
MVTAKPPAGAGVEVPAEVAAEAAAVARENETGRVPVRPGSLRRREVYERLRGRIVALQLAPGTALSENELAANLGVSRTPVREALIVLAEEGLVQVFPKVGSFVSRVDPRAVADAQFLREAVELASLADIPAQPDPMIVARIEANLAAQVEAAAGDAERFFALDDAFHREMLALAGHGNSWTAVQAAKGHLDRARRLGLGLDENALGRFAAEHQAIFAAATAQSDRTEARPLLRAHLRAVFDDIARVRAESPTLFVTDPDAVPIRRSVAVWP